MSLFDFNEEVKNVINRNFVGSGYLTRTNNFTKSDTDKNERVIVSEIIKKIFSDMNTFYNYDQCYGITLTFNMRRLCVRNLLSYADKHICYKKKITSYDPEVLHKHVIKNIQNSHLWKKTKYILFPEFTNNNSQLHYHGIIYGGIYQMDVVKICQKWKREFGYFKLEKKINNLDAWKKYIHKDYGKTGLNIIYKK